MNSAERIRCVASRWLRRVGHVEPGEGRLVAWSAAMFFFLLGGYFLLRPVREQFGVEGGLERLPLLFLGTVLATLDLSDDVEVYSNADDFLKGCVIARLDCALVDVRMPGETGFMLVKFLRASGISVPVILMTGDADVTLRTRAARYGACVLLAKPLTDTALVEAIETAVIGPPSVMAKPFDSN